MIKQSSIQLINQSVIHSLSLELTIKYTYRSLTSTGEESACTPSVSAQRVEQEPRNTPDEQQQGSNNMSFNTIQNQTTYQYQGDNCMQR